MKIVMVGPGQDIPPGAFMLSFSEAVLYAKAFGTKEVSIPGEFAKFASDLAPRDSQPLPSIPDRSIDAMELREFENMDMVSHATRQALEGKEWKADACQELLARFSGQRGLEQALRVLVMTHTRSVCSKGRYFLDGKERSIQMPQEDTMTHPGGPSDQPGLYRCGPGASH